MMKRSALLTILALTGACKESSGIKEVDRISNDLTQATGVQADITPVVRTARKAVLTAEAAGRNGNIEQMKSAVTQGTGEVLCSALENGEEISRSLGKDLEALDTTPGKTASETYNKAIKTVPEISADCQQR